MPSQSFFILSIIGVAALWSLGTSQSFAAEQASKPHIIMIMADDMGWMDLGCQGNKKMHTPRIDQLSTQGVRFTNAYAASPVCSPTRGSLMTGQSPARIHITQHGKDSAQFWPDNRAITPPDAEHVLPLETVTVAEHLQQRGYTTGFFGKWHLSGDKDVPGKTGPSFYPDHQGFLVNVGGCGFGGPPTYFDPFRIPTLPPRKTGEYLTHRLTDEMMQFMHTHKNEPMFICLWLYNPHYPFEAPADLIEKYKGQEGPGLKNATYGAQIESVDIAVGHIVDTLDKLGIADNTVLFFTSDNGGWTGATDNRPLRSGKGDLFEGGIRVPCIVRWPKIEKTPSPTNVINDTPIISMDITATILDVAGVTPPADQPLDGVSLRPIMQGKNIERDALYFHYPHFAFHKENRPGSAIRSGPHKLIYRFDDQSVELYDVISDIGETKNIAAENPAIAASLKQKLLDWLKDSGAQVPTPYQPANK